MKTQENKYGLTEGLNFVGIFINAIMVLMTKLLLNIQNYRMMKTGKLSVVVFIICLSGFLHKACGQDIITLKSNKQLKVKIVEIGTKEIKYRYFETPDGPIVTSDRKDVKTIKLEGVKDLINVSEEDKDPMSASNNAILDKTSSLKFSFFSPLHHNLAFSYETMVRPGLNWEAGIGIIGPGVGVFDGAVNLHPKGFFIRTGPKFLLGSSSDVEIEGVRYAHPLKGRYIKLEFIFNNLSTSFTDNFSATSPFAVKESYTSAALNLIYGRQYIVGNMLTLGWYVGLGYGIENKTSNSNFNYHNPIRYSHAFYGKDFPLTTTAGFTIGYVFKNPAWLNRLVHGKMPDDMPSRHSNKGKKVHGGGY